MTPHVMVSACQQTNGRWIFYVAFVYRDECCTWFGLVNSLKYFVATHIFWKDRAVVVVSTRHVWDFYFGESKELLNIVVRRRQVGMYACDSTSLKKKGSIFIVVV